MTLLSALMNVYRTDNISKAVRMAILEEALPYSEVLFHKYEEMRRIENQMSELGRAVTFYYVQFSSLRGSLKNVTFRISADTDNNMEDAFQKNSF